MTKDHEVDENPREALTPVDPLTRQKYYGSSNPMNRFVKSVGIRTEDRPDGSMTYMVAVQVEQSLEAAKAVRDHISALVTTPDETKQRRKGICICPKGETRGDCPACGDAEHRLPEEPESPQNMHSDEWWQAELDRCVGVEQTKYRALFAAYSELKNDDPDITAGVKPVVHQQLLREDQESRAAEKASAPPEIVHGADGDTAIEAK